TRFSRDWSSDVCSSDLRKQGEFAKAGERLTADGSGGVELPDAGDGMAAVRFFQKPLSDPPFGNAGNGKGRFRHREMRRRGSGGRSEERRVGKECRSR